MNVLVLSFDYTLLLEAAAMGSEARRRQLGTYSQCEGTVMNRLLKRPLKWVIVLRAFPASTSWYTP